jgi:Na+/H+ antiporter NhaA
VNEGLMAVFFFVVGLEIKQEIALGLGSGLGLGLGLGLGIRVRGGV